MSRNKNKSNQNLHKNKQRPKSMKPTVWKNEIKEIDDFFKSFELKLRDQKQKYLIKM